MNVWKTGWAECFSLGKSWAKKHMIATMGVASRLWSIIYAFYLSIYRSIYRSIYFMFFQAATFRKNHCLTETVWIDVNLLLQLRCLACERQLFRQGLLISWREITSWSISKTSKAWEGRNKVGTTDNNCSASLTESTSSFQILMISSKTEMWNCRSGSLADTTNHSHRTPPIVVSLITHMDHCWNPCLPQKRTYKMKSQQAPAFVIMIIMMYTLPEIGDISENPSHHWFATVWRSPQEKKTRVPFRNLSSHSFPMISRYTSYTSRKISSKKSPISKWLVRAAEAS